MTQTMITYVFFIQFYFAVYLWKRFMNRTPDLHIEKTNFTEHSLFHAYNLRVLTKHVDALYKFLNDLPVVMETFNISRSYKHTTCSIETLDDATSALYELALDHTDMNNVRFYINQMLIE